MAGHRSILERFFPAMFADDREVLGGLVTDDVVWHVPPSGVERFGEPRGAPAVLDFLCGAGGQFYEPGSFEMKAELEAFEADRAVVVAWLRARTARGKPYGNRYAFAFRFRDGRICEVWELLDTAHFASQLRGR
jgi:ketosteroid isomerase-like protein